MATGATPTAIAIVRISGPAAFAALGRIVDKPVVQPRRLTRRRLRDPADGTLLDEALVAIFPGPASATGDDLVELNLHGGQTVIAAILTALERDGLTPARRGAFTRRAFDNGKLDLGQVEALGDLIDAETEAQRRVALARTGGALAERIDRWRRLLDEARADVEAVIDFADIDDAAEIAAARSAVAIANLQRELAAARDDLSRGARLRDGLTVAIVGPVNAGKSTLLNALAGRDAAMVSPLPGTTRDVIEVRLALGGLMVNVVDTAGLRATEDELEGEGIARGVARAAVSDIVVALGENERSDALIVAAKCDLRSEAAGWRGGVLHLSAASGDGIDLLKIELERRAALLTQADEPPLIVHQWQRQALDEACAALTAASNTSDLVVCAEELRCVARALERLVGRASAEELLDTVFARFCIGK